MNSKSGECWTEFDSTGTESETGFVTLEELRSHIANAHRERKFRCDRCPAAFRYERELQTHAALHDENNYYNGDKFCTLYNAFFTHGISLTYHRKNFH